MANSARIISARRTILGLAGVSALGLILSSAPAEAWDFETDYTVTKISDGKNPQSVMIMLDGSAAMEQRVESPQSSGATTGWQMAKGQKWRNDQKTGWSSSQGAKWADPSHASSGVFYSADYINQPQFTEPSWGVLDGQEYKRGVWFDEPGSLWDIAVNETAAVLGDASSANPTLRFGVGTYSTMLAPGVVLQLQQDWANEWKSSYDWDGAETWLKVFEHAQQGGPLGDSPTPQALSALYDSETHTDENSQSAGLLVMGSQPNAYLNKNGSWYVVNYGPDGELLSYTKNKPDSAQDGGILKEYMGTSKEKHVWKHHYNAREQTLERACDKRGSAPLYVVGMGPAVDPNFNSMIAAVGGTGECVYGGQPVDPCEAIEISGTEERREMLDEMVCTGAIQADNRAQYRQALREVTEQLECTYPLDVAHTPDNQAPEDPAGTRVYLGECPAGPATRTAWGGEYVTSDGFSVGANISSSSPLGSGRSCTKHCGVLKQSADRLVYSVPTTPGVSNQIRVRVADYLSEGGSRVRMAVYADNNPNNPGANEFVGYWTGEGIGEWNIAEFSFVPSKSETYISVVLEESDWCGSDGSQCPQDQELFVDWVKVVDPGAGCAADGQLTHGSDWVYTPDRRGVRLIGEACENVVRSEDPKHVSVTTQVAASCDYPEGYRCLSPRGADCPMGRWQCSGQWQDVCVPDETCTDGACAEVEVHDILLNKPNVQLAVDNTGSMRFYLAGSQDGQGWDDPLSRHRLAQVALENLATWNESIGTDCELDPPGCERLNLGIHFWADPLRPYRAAKSGMTAATIKKAFDLHTAGTHTYFESASRLLQCEVDPNSYSYCTVPGGRRGLEAGSKGSFEGALGTPGRVNIGIIVTDGGPWSEHGTASRAPDNPKPEFKYDSTIRAMRQLCALQHDEDNPVPAYVFSFGPSTRAGFNSMLAAAGGTGRCCIGEDCDLDNPAQRLDVCDEDAYDDELLHELMRSAKANGKRRRNSDWPTGEYVYAQCDGYFEGNDGEALQEKLMTLLDELSCVYSINELPAGMSAASENTERTRINLNWAGQVGGQVRVPHLGSPEEMKDVFVDELGAKGVSQPESYRDQGWEYLNEARKHVRFSDKVCGLINARKVKEVETQACGDCQNVGRLCHVGEGGSEFSLDEELIARERTRCQLGVVVCEEGVERCDAFSPMPEVCNGWDDDCDGQVDNLHGSWQDEQFADKDYSLGDTQPFESAACYERNVCVCTRGQAKYKDYFDPENLGYFSDDFDEYLAAWDDRNLNTCLCGEGVAESSAPPMSTGAGPEEAAEPGAMCSMSGTSDPSPLHAWWLAAAAGIVGARRARQRRGAR